MPTAVDGGVEALAAQQAGKAAQAAITAQAMRDAVTLWPLLDPKRVDATFPGWLRAMSMLIGRYRPQSALAAGTTYRQAREAFTQSPAPASLIRVAPAAPAQWLERAYGYSGPGMLSQDTARPNTALSTTLGTTARIVADAGRTTTLQTMHADPVAVGWYRITDGHPCAFCALLASRGVAYKSERTADFQAHNDCGCTAAVAFHADHPIPDVNQQAADVYHRSVAHLPNAQRIAAFRQAWDAHQAAQAT